jgi:dihydropteroate synthase
MTLLDCGGRAVDLARPAVMGILNITPDSFSDGGVFFSRDQALRRIEAMADEGADIIDVGGESTRPGARPVSVQEELDRVIPVIEAARDAAALPVSVDTTKPEVMRAAVAAGAGMINDVNALQAPSALKVAAALDVTVCLMHMQGEPRTMQRQPQYRDVLGEVCAFLAERRKACIDGGVSPGRIVIDPGFGFGKTLDHNLTLLRHLERLCSLGAPVLVGLSRKSMIGAIVDAPVGERTYGSVAAALIAVQKGAAIVRVHDVRATRDALKVYAAVNAAEQQDAGVPVL